MVRNERAGQTDRERGDRSRDERSGVSGEKIDAILELPVCSLTVLTHFVNNISVYTSVIIFMLICLSKLSENVT